MNTIAESGRNHGIHRARRSSGIKWLGEVPQHWDLLRLKYCADLVNEKVNGSACELPYTGLEHIQSWTGKRLAVDAATSSSGQASLHRAGDVLFGKLRPYLAKAYVAENEGICTSELLVLRPKAVLQRFLRDYLLSPCFIAVVDSSTYGAKMPRASWDFISSLPVLVPPIDEQRAIVAFLDRETSRIDALIEKKQRQIELLQEKRSALISHAVTKGLDPNAPMKDSGIDWLGEVPAHWTTCPIKRVSTLIQTGSTPPTARQEYYADGTVPWYGPGSFGANLVLREPVKLLSDAALQDGVARLFSAESILVVSIGATIGKVGYLEAPASCNQQITAVTPNPEKALGKFLAYQLKHLEPVLREIAPSSTLRILDQQKIGYLPCALPPLTEQRGIAAFLDGETRKIDVIIERVNLSIDRLREYRAALISAAVTGKIDVSQEAV